MLIILLIVLSSFIVSSSYHNNNNTTIVLLTVIDEKRSSSEYGSFKADMLKYLSIQNRLRYCIKHDVTCVIGIGTPRRGRNKLNRLFKRSRVRKDKYVIYSSRYLKISWILHLLNSDVQNIMYLDEDAFITKSFNAQSVFDTLKSTTCLGLTPDITYNRYNSGVMFIKNCQSTYKIFNKLMEIHQSASEIENHSDQLVLNRLIDNSNYDIQNISNIISNVIKNIYNKKYSTKL